MDTPARQGQNTGAFGKWLTAYLKDAAAFRDFEVYYDHGDTAVDANVVAVKGFCGTVVTNLNRLADVDVIVVAPNGNVCLLIEIEERPSSPKKYLGSMLATLICDRFAVRISGSQRYFTVSDKTSLIVAGVVPAAGHRLQKIEAVILPRIRQLGGLPGAIPPANVDFVFSETIQSTIEKLRTVIARLFPVVP
jgi:hypothetical protein